MNDNEIKPLIQDVKCERIVVGTILSINGSYYELAEFLDEDCFRDSKCLHVYKAEKSLADKGENIDIITVTSELIKNQAPVLPYDVANIMQEGVAYDIRHLALRLKELSIRRRMWVLGQRLINAGVTEADDIADIQQKASEELNGLFGSIGGIFTLTDALVSLADIITANMSKGAHTTGTKTGFMRLDEKGGLHGSDLIIIGGETSMGKTSFLTAIMKNAIEAGEPVAMYSMEMTKEQMAARIVSMKTGIPASDIMYSSELSNEDVACIDNARKELPGDLLFFDDDSTSNIDSILLSIRNMYLKYKIKGAAVDYLQILSVNSKSGMTREQQMGDASRRLKNLAKELNIWIIALSQLSRNSQEPAPSLSRLRDSGQIAEAADVVMFVYRPSLKNETFPYPFENIPAEDIPKLALIDVAKGRNIGVFKFLVNFDDKTTYFTDIEQEEGGTFDSFDSYQPIEEDAPF